MTTEDPSESNRDALPTLRMVERKLVDLEYTMERLIRIGWECATIESERDFDDLGTDMVRFPFWTKECQAKFNRERVSIHLARSACAGEVDVADQRYPACAAAPDVGVQRPNGDGN